MGKLVLEINCRVAKPDQPTFDLCIRLSTPTRSADGAHYDCGLQLVGDQLFPIGGQTPFDSLLNAIRVAKAFAEGKDGRNAVEWR